MIDHLILNICMAEKIVHQSDPGDILEALDSEDRICSVITAGARGCWFKEKNGGIYHMPAFNVQAIDTTGCGDVFHGAYAAAVIQGAPIPTAIRQASAAAALKATQPGGRQGIPTLDRLLDFCQRNAQPIPVEAGS